MITRKEILTVTLDEGKAEGSLICSLSGWDCEIYRIQRSNLSDYDNDQKLKECGIYFLIGEENGIPTIYVGQANSRTNGKGVLGRVEEHDKAKESYWSEALLLHSNSNSLYATELNYLERSFWIKTQAGSYTVKNASKPALGNYPQMIKITMDKFISSAETIIRLLGYSFLVPKAKKIQTTSGNKQFFIKRKGNNQGRDIDAICEIQNNKFVVIKGSLVATVPRNANEGRDYYHNKYGAFIDNNGRLTQDIEFDKVSGSSAFVIYGSSDGNVDWKDASGKPIKDFI